MAARVVPVGCLFLAALAGACSDSSSTGPGAPLDASGAADSGSRLASSTADGSSQGAQDSSAGGPDVGIVSVSDTGVATDAPIDARGGSPGGGTTPTDGGSTAPIDAGTVGPPVALDISGTIVDKVWALIPGAQVCLQGSTTTCVSSGADGTFHIQGVGPLSLVVSATGYATAVYHPKTAAETGDWVLLAVPGENVELLFDGKTLDGWLQSSGAGLGNVPGTWDVQDAAVHCVGTVRGTLVTKGDYGDYRLIFAVRQLPFTLGKQPLCERPRLGRPSTAKRRARGSSVRSPQWLFLGLPSRQARRGRGVLHRDFRRAEPHGVEPVRDFDSRRDGNRANGLLHAHRCGTMQEPRGAAI